MKRKETSSSDGTATDGRLTALSGAQLGRSYLVRAPVTLGRGACEIELDDSEASRAHTRVWREPDGTFQVEDLRSRNGTFVNGVQIKRAPLVFGDRLRVGRTTFLFSRHDEESEVLFQRNRVDTVGHITLGLVHDFNNALCVIKSMSALLQDEPSMSKAARDECLEDMTAACERAEQLTKRMMGFARGHESAGTLDLHEVVTEGARLVRRALPPDVQLVVDLPRGLRMFGESIQLMQVLLNLVINARDAIASAGRPGQIRVSAARHDDEILLSVHDDGCGMSAEVKARVFEPFFTTKGAKGNGIGLASVFEIVRNHGGRVEVTSAPDEGTTITVHLRAEADGPTSWMRGTIQADAVIVSGGSGQRVLVVDADAGARRSIGKTLYLAGYAVDTRAAPEEPAPNAAPYDVIVADLEHDAQGHLARLVAHETQRNARLTLVCLATTAHDGILAQARSLGAVAVLPKPFARADLLVALQRALTLSTGSDEDETRQYRRPRG